MKSLCIAVTAVVFLSLLPLRAHAQTPHIIYNSIPKPLPGNIASEGPEAYAFSELGDGLIFTESNDTLDHVTVVLSSWACTSGRWYTNDCVTSPAGATFDQPITMNIYAVDNSNPSRPLPGDLITTLTQTFAIAYRPSSDPARCDKQSWYSDKDKTCYHGISVPVDFDLSKLDVTLPSEAIVTLTFNTTSAGPNPIGTSASCFSSSGGCPYDSLNIGTDGNGGLIGNTLDPTSIFVNYISDANACPGNTTTGVLALDSPGNLLYAGCWTGYHPQIKVVTRPTNSSSSITRHPSAP